MKVILIKDVERLGRSGDTVEVKPGYARNYLIPAGLALVATKENFKRLEEIRNRERKILEKQKIEAQKLKSLIENTSLTITCEVKEDDQIYGTVAETQIVKALKNEGIEVDKEKINLTQPIKKLGVYQVEIVLHPEVVATLRVWVVKK
jgi:large subunit ribosomal protein L9